MNATCETAANLVSKNLDSFVNKSDIWNRFCVFNSPTDFPRNL